jgi:hypothetical protein
VTTALLLDHPEIRAATPTPRSGVNPTDKAQCRDEHRTVAATLLLDDPRRPPTQVDATADGHSPATVEGTTRRRWTWLLPVAAGLAAVTTAAVLAIELRDADFADALARTDLTWVAVAIGVFGLSILSAAYNLMGFSALRLRLAPTLLAQLAVGGLRVITPSALSTPAIATRYLVQSGASTPDALATVGAAQTAQLLATMLVVAGLAALSGSDQLSMPSATGLLIGAAVLIAVAVVASLAARRSQRALHGLRAGGTCSPSTRTRRGGACCVRVAYPHPRAGVRSLRTCGRRPRVARHAVRRLSRRVSGWIVDPDSERSGSGGGGADWWSGRHGPGAADRDGGGAALPDRVGVGTRAARVGRAGHTAPPRTPLAGHWSAASRRP